jgi:N-acetylglucosaminyldiphosphoundecaprenol N-acetyl-beta-D-mannosaminyltransferase
MERVSLMGLDIDAMTEEQAVTSVVDRSLTDEGGWVITPNLDHLRSYRRRPELRRHFHSADLLLADGMPLVWASRLQATPLPERVAGSDLIWSLSREAAERGASIYLVGGNPGSAEAAAGVLSDAVPDLEVAGAHSPPMGFLDDAAERRRTERAVAEADPDIVYVGLPFDKHVELVPRLRERMPHAWFVGLGVSFSFVCGEVRRAPDWMRSAGLEWIHRLAQEPRRLVRRYLLEGLPFTAELFAHALRRRLA